MAAPSRNEIIIAVIGLVGVIFTGVVSNWDKISSASRNGPIVSDDINVQLRYFAETSGLRESLVALEKANAERLKHQFRADPQTVNCMLDMGPSTNQMMEIAVGSLKNHFTLDEIKELNRINSLPAMVKYAEKQPAITLDLLNGLEEAGERANRRNAAIARSSKKKDADSAACPAAQL